MAVNLVVPAPDAVLPVPGVELAVASAGVKPGSQPGDRDDLALLVFAPGTTLAAVFTRSAFPAACVTLGKRHLASTAPRAVLVNSGNANCATGRDGEAAALACCSAVAEALGVARETVLPSSTGVIGEALPVPRILARVPDLVAGLDAGHWLPAARAIMTTDTLPKLVSRRLPAPLDAVVITGIAKGSGMIQPDMATMLAYLATNASLPQAVLDALLRRVVERSFNRITVDSDTSTNDSVLLAATGQGPAVQEGAALDLLEAELTALARDLAVMVVRDGEGATRLVSVEVRGAASAADALAVARSIANSPLVKTALFAADPNWGRLVMAIGKAGMDGAAVDPGRVALDLASAGESVAVARGGQLVTGYAEADAARVMGRDEVSVQVDLGLGEGAERVWTSDFSYDYVKINAEYRT